MIVTVTSVGGSDDGVTLTTLAPSMPVLAETGDDVNEKSIVGMLTAKH